MDFYGILYSSNAEGGGLGKLVFFVVFLLLCRLK